MKERLGLVLEISPNAKQNSSKAEAQKVTWSRMNSFLVMLFRSPQCMFYKLMPYYRQPVIQNHTTDDNATKPPPLKSNLYA
jgi:hypothetical protein